MKIFYILTLFLITSSSVLAAMSGHEGKIVYYDLDGTASGKSACIKMAPPLPSPTSTVGCIYTVHSLSSELNALLLTAYTASKTCSVYWEFRDASNHAIIRRVICQ